MGINDIIIQSEIIKVMNRGVSMLDTNNSNRMLVTFPHSKKYPYLTSYCLLANALYVGLNVFLILVFIIIYFLSCQFFLFYLFR